MTFVIKAVNFRPFEFLNVFFGSKRIIKKYHANINIEDRCMVKITLWNLCSRLTCYKDGIWATPIPVPRSISACWSTPPKCWQRTWSSLIPKAVIIIKINKILGPSLFTLYLAKIKTFYWVDFCVFTCNVILFRIQGPLFEIRYLGCSYDIIQNVSKPCL